MRKLIGTKGQFIGKGTQHLRDMDRPTAGGHPDQRELVHGPDKIQHGQTEDNRPQLGERDMAEKLAAIGAIDGASLVELIGNALQTRQQADHIEGITRPNIDKGNRM